MNFGAVFGEFIRQPFNVENAVEGVAVNTRIFKRPQCLLAKRTAIDKEENAFKTLGLDQRNIMAIAVRVLPVPVAIASRISC